MSAIVSENEQTLRVGFKKSQHEIRLPSRRERKEEEVERMRRERDIMAENGCHDAWKAFIHWRHGDDNVLDDHMHNVIRHYLAQFYFD